MSAIDLCYGRLAPAEGIRRLAYNDRTGERVTCRPAGNLTIGEGINLEDGLDDAEIEWLSRHRLALCEQELLVHGWYVQYDDARKSAILELAYNQGERKLELQWPRFIAALERHDLPGACAELKFEDPRLEDRARGLRNILLTGMA